MKSKFDMALFLSPVLKGAHATRQRHIRQAERMHEVIRERWGCATPWAWREKHLRWFLDHYLRCSAPMTVYYYELTAGLIRRRKANLWFVEKNANSFFKITDDKKGSFA